MLPTPKKYFVTAGSSEGKNNLTAFDNALLKGGIGNLNLMRVTSILPPGVQYCPDMKIPPGSLVPTAYGFIISDIPGELIAAAVGVGFSKDTFGVIMEYSGKCSKEDAEKTIENMLKEAFETRGMELAGTKIAATEHRVEKIGCALAAVPLWY
ncbi:MAG: pyruvoyl-dependent arginine decarboxylase [Pelotomaculum sp. PtaU1.Bin035]|nr:MAG: pyruvoyl-dependent arginine decarboxylase [Pelotomaculum sp. PtaU1.Bin035]